MILAGFECARIGEHRILDTTGHHPDALMYQHYALARMHGINSARDGISPDCDPVARFQTAKAAGLQVIWDLDHWWHHEDPVFYARRLALAHLAVYGGREALWVCPANEPSVAATMQFGATTAEKIEIGRMMLAEIRRWHPNVLVLSTDPFHDHRGDLPGADGFDPDVIGIDVYPHHLSLETSLEEVLQAAARRGKWVMIAETSWHEGLAAAEARFPDVRSKGNWLRKVQAAVDASGVRCLGICWYPIIDTPQWHDPGHPVRWSHGLIRANLGLDESLSSAILEAHGKPSLSFFNSEPRP